MHDMFWCMTPQISKALAGADRKDLMRRLPKFIYDEEKALEVRNFGSPLIFSQVLFHVQVQQIVILDLIGGP